ncbi:AAA family ATPase [Crossiella sp. CA-258035]|uniref:AAA family ATPase n=1 Tax=Crossiella sp. CA-258035 TaxID=2981138 RepID=UPI0024BD447A|nr:AAA family ATPase [Crossiella sp. CA-258035]WHT16588.1 AAA family ATPase [Crossiella sp. CA-258035]
MYISRVRLENIRGFHGARNVDLTLTRPDRSHAGWTVIAGRNGSGKTSLLRAIALAASGPHIARSVVPDFDNWLSTDSDAGLADVNLEVDRSVDPFESLQPMFSEVYAGLKWHTSTRGHSRKAMLRTKVTSDVAVAMSGPWQENRSGWLCVAYGPFRRLTGGTPDTQRLMSGPGPVARVASLFHEDASLAEGVGWLIQQHLRTFEEKPGARELRDAVLLLLADGLLPDGYRIKSVDSEGLHVEKNGNQFPLREMSDGYRVVTALVVDIVKQIHDAYGDLPLDTSGVVPAITAPGVVIIDEVDAHLHVSWQKRIGGWLKQHFPRIQFIVTTHSPYICQAADPGGLIRLPGPDENVAPTVVDEDLYERVVYGSGDDAALSELFGLDSPYSEDAEKLRRELVALEMVVLAGEADDEQIQRYKNLRKTLTSSQLARNDEVAARLMSRGAL